eukprot:6896566-Pyramimonas_sp.AAC.1
MLPPRGGAKAAVHSVGIAIGRTSADACRLHLIACSPQLVTGPQRLARKRESNAMLAAQRAAPPHQAPGNAEI